MLTSICRAVLALAVACSARSALADTAAAEPWQVGVTEAQKAAAQAELDRGNALYVENRYEDALVAYRAGLASWNHPSIQFNMATTLIALDRPVDALAALELAMQYGERALKEQWREALNYKALLARQVGTLVVSCPAGAEVTLDTATAIRCPGQTEHRVRAGEHVVLAQQPGHLTKRATIVVAGGARVEEKIALVALKDAAITRTRWATWKPWLVVAGGAVAAVGGVAFELNSRSLFGTYRDRLRVACGDLACASDPEESLRRRAVLYDRVGVSMMVVGGAAVAAGVVLVVMNRPFTEVPSERSVAVLPVVSADGLGVTVRAGW